MEMTCSAVTPEMWEEFILKSVFAEAGLLFLGVFLGLLLWHGFVGPMLSVHINRSISRSDAALDAVINARMRLRGLPTSEGS